MRGQVLLEVEVGHLNLRRGVEEIAEGIVEDNLATVLGVLQTLLGDVSVDQLGHFGSGYKIVLGDIEECSQLRAHILLAVETIIVGALLCLLTIGILLGALDLTNDLGEGFDISAKCGDLGLNGFKGHYISPTSLVFKWLKRGITRTTPQAPR